MAQVVPLEIIATHFQTPFESVQTSIASQGYETLQHEGQECIGWDDLVAWTQATFPREEADGFLAHFVKVEMNWEKAEESQLQRVFAERRASGWLPTLAIADAVQQPAEQVQAALEVYGVPKTDEHGSYFRWNWVYEWAATQFHTEGHEDYIRETAEGILEQAGGDMDRALNAAIQHTAKLYAAEIVEAVLDING